MLILFRPIQTTNFSNFFLSFLFSAVLLSPNVFCQSENYTHTTFMFELYIKNWIIFPVFPIFIPISSYFDITIDFKGLICILNHFRFYSFFVYFLLSKQIVYLNCIFFHILNTAQTSNTCGIETLIN